MPGAFETPRSSLLNRALALGWVLGRRHGRIACAFAMRQRSLVLLIPRMSAQGSSLDPPLEKRVTFETGSMNLY